MPNPEVIVYSRTGCHLCEVALQVLHRHGLQPTVIDLDTQPQLLDQYDHWVPVVVWNGQVRFRGQVDERLLRRLLHQSD